MRVFNATFNNTSIIFIDGKSEYIWPQAEIKLFGDILLLFYKVTATPIIDHNKRDGEWIWLDVVQNVYEVVEDMQNHNN